MNPFSRRRAVALLLALTGAVAAAGPASARLVPGDGVASGGSPVAVAAPATVTTAVRSSLACELVRDLRLCSHGDDAHLAGATTAAGGTGSRSSSTASTRIGCYTRGPRVQAVYARPDTAPDRYSASAASFRGWAGAVEKAVDDSAHKTGGARHVRFASSPSGDTCTLSVLRVVLPAKAFASFPATIRALQDVGLDDVGMKYLVWADAKGYCGIASTYADDDPSQDNLNNGRFPSYARVDRACWGKAEAHELLHMLGAVQRGAPHATEGMHCRDGSDVMCYDDGTRGSAQSAVCASSHSRLLDCRGDDYFSTAPASGSWLAAHWNTASSAFLARGWTDPAPAPQGAAPAEAAPRPSPSRTPSPSRSPSPSPSPSATPAPPGGLLPPLVLPTLAGPR